MQRRRNRLDIGTVLSRHSKTTVEEEAQDAVTPACPSTVPSSPKLVAAVVSAHLTSASTASAPPPPGVSRKPPPGITRHSAGANISMSPTPVPVAPTSSGKSSFANTAADANLPSTNNDLDAFLSSLGETEPFRVASLVDVGTNVNQANQKSSAEAIEACGGSFASAGDVRDSKIERHVSPQGSSADVSSVCVADTHMCYVSGTLDIGTRNEGGTVDMYGAVDRGVIVGTDMLDVDANVSRDDGLRAGAGTGTALMSGLVIYSDDSDSDGDGDDNAHKDRGQAQQSAIVSEFYQENPKLQALLPTSTSSSPTSKTSLTISSPSPIASTVSAASDPSATLAAQGDDVRVGVLTQSSSNLLASYDSDSDDDNDDKRLQPTHTPSLLTASATEAASAAHACAEETARASTNDLTQRGLDGVGADVGDAEGKPVIGHMTDSIADTAAEASSVSTTDAVAAPGTAAVASAATVTAATAAADDVSTASPAAVTAVTSQLDTSTPLSAHAPHIHATYPPISASIAAPTDAPIDTPADAASIPLAVPSDDLEALLAELDDIAACISVPAQTTAHTDTASITGAVSAQDASVHTDSGAAIQSGNVAVVPLSFTPTGTVPLVEVSGHAPLSPPPPPPSSAPPPPPLSPPPPPPEGVPPTAAAYYALDAAYGSVDAVQYPYGYDAYSQASYAYPSTHPYPLSHVLHAPAHSGAVAAADVTSIPAPLYSYAVDTLPQASGAHHGLGAAAATAAEAEAAALLRARVWDETLTEVLREAEAKSAALVQAAMAAVTSSTATASATASATATATAITGNTVAAAANDNSTPDTSAGATGDAGKHVAKDATMPTPSAALPSSLSLTTSSKLSSQSTHVLAAPPTSTTPAPVVGPLAGMHPARMAALGISAGTTGSGTGIQGNAVNQQGKINSDNAAKRALLEGNTFLAAKRAKTLAATAHWQTNVSLRSEDLEMEAKKLWAKEEKAAWGIDSKTVETQEIQAAQPENRGLLHDKTTNVGPATTNRAVVDSIATTSPVETVDHPRTQGSQPSWRTRVKR